jgi:hypothetical protein
MNIICSNIIHDDFGCLEGILVLIFQLSRPDFGTRWVGDINLHKIMHDLHYSMEKLRYEYT